ncbi:AdoMet-homocysteine methyltransferase [Diplodia seriata]|uniref:AdoMet-homocysteine methyltransferase n=1 Tax=Diplodia seriata TaxID=420778 RepID=A0ABR3BX93_9PEZI
MATVQILDGGLGTSLEDKYGVKFNHSQPLWSSHFLIDNQDTLLACQRDFVEAGADVLLTATYQVSIEGFARTKTADFPNGIPKNSIPSYLARAVEVAEQASSHGTAKIGLSLGPYGASMVPGQEYSGKYDAEHDTEESLYQWHLERLRLFAAVERLLDRVQYIALETLPRLDEIRAVRRAVQALGATTEEAGPRLWISCVFPGESEDLPDGSTIDQVVEAMLGNMSDGCIPWGIGMNCTKMHKLPGLIRKFEDAVGKLQAATPLHSMPTLVLYPDGTNREVYNTTTKQWEKPDHMAGETQLKLQIMASERGQANAGTANLSTATDWDLDSAIDSASDMSSYTTSLLREVTDYKYENGRRYHAYREGAYVLPNDEQDQDRQDLLHHIRGLLLDGKLFRAPIEKASTDGSGPRRVLDDPFDYIHVRDLGGAIQDWNKLLDQSMRNLKRGGYMELQEFDVELKSDDGSLEEHAPNATQLLALLQDASRKFGKNMDNAKGHAQRLREAGFEQVETEAYRVPVGAWPLDAKLKEIGRYNFAATMAGIDSYSLALLTRVLGWDSERTQLFLSTVKKELQDPKVHVYGDWYVVWGRKPN